MGGVDFVYMNANNENIGLAVPIDPTALVFPGDQYPKFQYTHTFEVNYLILAMDGSQLKQNETITYVNQQFTIEQNQIAIQASGF